MGLRSALMGMKSAAIAMQSAPIAMRRAPMETRTRPRPPLPGKSGHGRPGRRSGSAGAPDRFRGIQRTLLLHAERAHRLRVGGRGAAEVTSFMRPRLGVAALLMPLALWLGASNPPRGAPNSIGENANRTPAGRLRGDTLEIHLAVGMGTWRPEADSGPAIEVAAFAEEGHAPLV